MTETNDNLLASDDIDPSMLIRKQKTKRTIFIVVLLAALGVGGFFLYRALTTVDQVPNRVVVAFSVTTEDGTRHGWWLDGNEASESWSESLGTRLEGLELEAMTINSDLKEAFDGITDPAAFQDACAAAGASYVVLGDVKTVNTAPRAKPEFVDYILELDLEILDCDEARGSIDVLPTPVRLLRRDSEELAAMVRNIDYAEDLFLGPLAAAFVERPGIVALKDGGSDLPLEHAEIFNELEKKLFAFANDYSLRMREREEAVAEARVNQTGLEASESERTLLGDFIAQEDMVGALPDGVLILNETVQYGFTWPPGEIVVDTAIEQLIKASPDGSDREILFEHDNIFSFPSVSSDGAFVAFVQANGRDGKSLALVNTKSGEYTPVLVHAEHYYSSPVPSAGGSHIGFRYYPYRRADHSYKIVEVETRDNWELLSAEDWWSVPRWNASGTHLYFSLKRADEAYPSVYRYEVASRTLEPLLGPARDAVVAAESPTPETIDPAAEPTTDAPDSPLGLDAPPDTSPGGDVGDLDDAEIPEPTAIPEYVRVAPSPDGDFALIVEEDGRGGRFLGRLDLETLDYERVREFPSGFMVISPDAEWVAVQTHEVEHNLDPHRGDDEIVAFRVDGTGEPVFLTSNDVEDYLREWAFDSSAVYATQYSGDPTFRRSAVRAFRIELGDPK